MTQSDLDAQAFMEGLDALVARISWLQPRHARAARKARGRRTVSRQFMLTTATSVEQSEELQRMKKLDPAVTRLVFQDDAAWKPAIDKVAVLLSNLKFSLEIRKADVAEASLQIFHIAQGLARDPDGAGLESVVENMRRDLGRKGRGSKVNPAPAEAVSTGRKRTKKRKR
jgi:hypothetical protein